MQYNLFNQFSANKFGNTTNCKKSWPQSWSPGLREQILFSQFFFFGHSKIKQVPGCQGHNHSQISYLIILLTKPRIPREIIFKLKIKKSNHLRIEERNQLDTFISTSVGWKTWKFEIWMTFRVQVFACFFIFSFLINRNIRSTAEPRQLLKSVV